MIHRNLCVWCLGCAILGVAVASASEWPAYRGPQGSGITPEKIETAWSAAGPKVLWTVPLGPAFGSFAVGGGKAFVYQEKPDDHESCTAFDEQTSKELWSTDIDKLIKDGEGGDGPRTTPALDGDRVYVLSTYLKLDSLSASDGKVLWSHDLKTEFGGREPHWGNAASPIVEGDVVIAAGGSAGQSLVGFDKKTGAVLWKGESEKITHAAPTPATIAGVRQVIFYVQSGLVSVEPATGKVLWKAPFPYNVSTAASPVVGDDVVYCSAGYGVGAGAFKITKKDSGTFAAEQMWRMPNGDVNHWSTPVYRDGFVYGLYGFKEFRTEPLKCIELATGKEKWSQPGFGQGGLIRVGDNLLVQGDQGQLVLASASSDGYHELARSHPLAGKCWTMPVVADGKIFCRSTKQGVCLDVSGTK